MKRKYKPSDPYLNVKLTKTEKQQRQYSTKILKWTTIVTHIDMDTGEVLTPHEAKQNYTKIKTDKHAKIANQEKTRGEIRLYILYRKNIQTTIW